MLGRFHAAEGAALAKRLASIRRALDLLPVISKTSAVMSQASHPDWDGTVPW